VAFRTSRVVVNLGKCKKEEEACNIVIEINQGGTERKHFRAT